MQDLELWRALQTTAVNADAILPMLEQLNACELPARVPFFGPATNLLHHPQARLRKAALECLAGASGSFAFRHLVRALSDEDPEVRTAALESLRTSAGNDPPRWAHVLFHHDPEIRRAGLAGEPVEDVEWFALYLLPDPDCEDLAAKHLLKKNSIVPGSTLPAIIEMVQIGRLDVTLARRLIVQMIPLDRNRWIHDSHARTPSMVTTILDVATGPAADDSLARTESVDALDQLIDLFWEPDLPQEKASEPNPKEAKKQPPQARFFSDLIDTLKHDETGARLRAVASMAVIAARRGTWPQLAAEACMALYPQFLLFQWVPESLRRDAIRVLYRLGTNCRREPDAIIKNMVLSEPARKILKELSVSPAEGFVFTFRTDEVSPLNTYLDLYIIGGLLHLLQHHPYKLLQEWIPIPEIVTAFWADPESAVSLLSLSDKSERGRSHLLKEICAHRKPKNHALFALMVQTIPADGYDFLETLSAEEAVSVFGAILDLAEAKKPKRLSENKTRVAGEYLSLRILSARTTPILEFLRVWLKALEPELFPLGLAMFGHLADSVSIERLRNVLASLTAEELPRVIKLIGWCPGFPYAKERQLAQDYLEHPNWDIRRWAMRCIPNEAGEVVPPTSATRGIPRTGLPLSAEQAAIIGICTDSVLESALKPALENPCRGLCEALAKRLDPPAPNVQVCVALLGSHDSLRLINEQFQRYANPEDPVFVQALEQAMVNTWLRRQELPMIGHAWLYRWEAHAFAFLDLAAKHPDAWEGQMRYVINTAGPNLTVKVWEAIGRVIAFLRFRDLPGLTELWTTEFAELAVKNLGTPNGLPAAKLLMHGLQARLMPAHFEYLRSQVIARLPMMTKEEHETLRRWVSPLGVATMPVELRPVKGSANEETLTEIANCSDLEQLESWCLDENSKIAVDAALRLLEFGEPGAARLLKILSTTPSPPSAFLLAETVSLWPEGPALVSVHDLLIQSQLPVQLRFLIGLQLLERGHTEIAGNLFDLINTETQTTWFQESDWQRLQNAGLKKFDLAVAVCGSPQLHAYLPAVRWLLKQETPSEDVIAAVRKFLESDSQRLFELRVKTALWLRDQGDLTGFPILIQHAIQVDSAINPLIGAGAKEINATVNSALLAGGSLFSEERLFEFIKDGVRNPWLQQQAFEPMLARCLSDSVRESIVPKLRRTMSRSLKLRRVAEEFAWGIRIGRELTGRLFSVNMIAGEDLGYTRLQENKIYITPMPILRGERNARDVVQGLILHEYGHHMYHRGEQEEAIWEQAQEEKLGRLLNLVSDEHLERNLRALDINFGDRLKKLAAYAFQHSKKEMPVEDLLTSLQGRAFEVLVGTKLQVARKRGCVVVDNGQLLLEMERSGISFARFVRALRMGLGNRHDDPKVEAGLELFRKKFRKSSMQELLEISRKLREIFGWECSLLESFSQDECLSADPSDIQAHGEGITNQDVESEIQRITNPRHRTDRDVPGMDTGGRWINVSAEEDFETITTIIPKTFDRNEHARYAQEVNRPARQLKQYLKDLGLAMVPQRMRIQGRILDRSRIPAVVLRNDPRMLIARQRQTHNDLFIGTVIDCSGSMDYDDNIEKAKMFGALLAEAVNGLDGVDLRLFGFTDCAIYDAGNQHRPAVHALQAGGGNNDAAALWYAAQVAMASRRKAKLLVMISDGLPTECSAEALRGLATRLTNRHKICCAQVAVQNLEEICFPHYILLDDEDLNTSVRRFGTTVAKLVRRAMSG